MRQRWIDEYYMRQALDLALRGTGKTTPNPLVGCVIVKDGEVVGRGWHDHLGGLHAEAAALLDAGEKAHGATAYVSLEPCSHQGRQPPCAPALVRAGISRCVAALGDPNPKVSGRGFKILEDAGISVTRGILEKEAAWLNRGFLSLQVRGRPWVTLKAAISADGSTALENGASQWITGEDARGIVHMLRAENDAILIGTGTLFHDNPSLTVRHTEGISPRPVIVSGSLDWISDAEKFSAIRDDSIIFSFRGAAVPEKFISQVYPVPAYESGRPDLKFVLEKLGELGLARVLVEAGGTMCSSFIKRGLVDEYQLFVASKFMGEGKKITGALRLNDMSDSVAFRIRTTHAVGDDLWIEGGSQCSPDWLKQ